MQRREKILSIALLTALLIAMMGWWGLPLLRGVFLGPLEERWSQIDRLETQKKRLEVDELKVIQSMKQMRAWREHSLPPDPLEAQGLYMEWLTDLAQRAQIGALHVIPEQREGGGNAFKVVSITLKGEATFEQLVKFLYDFQRADLLHRLAALKIDSPKNPGGPLTVTMTAEGLCLQSVPPRDRLLAHSQLAASLPRSFDTLKVVSGKEFPSEPGFNVQIDNEILAVTKIAGDDWTVKRAVEGTTADRHKEKADVELFPVRADRMKPSLEERKKELANHPFARAIIAVDETARQTRLMGSVTSEKDPVAWLYNASNRSRTEVRKGTAISIGDIRGTVVAVEPTCIRIERNGAVWQVNMGRNLQSMRRVDDGGMDDGGLSDFSMDPSGAPAGSRGPRGPGGNGRNRFNRSRGRGPNSEGSP